MLSFDRKRLERTSTLDEEEEKLPPRSGGTLRAVLLLASLLALVLGVFAAVYLDHLHHPTEPSAVPVVKHEVPPQATATTPLSPPTQPTATQPTASSPAPEPSDSTAGKAGEKAPSEAASPSAGMPASAASNLETPGAQAQGAPTIGVVPPLETPPQTAAPMPAQAPPTQKSPPKPQATSTPAKPEAPARPTFERVYWVQFGAYRQKMNADRDAATLTKNGIRVIVEPVNTPFGIAFYRVRAIGLPSRKAALDAAQHGKKLLGTRQVWSGHVIRRRPAQAKP